MNLEIELESMKIREGLPCFGFLWLITSTDVLSAEMMGDKDLQALGIEHQSLSNVLKRHHWVGAQESLITKPNAPRSNEIVTYYGNVLPTSLYKNDIFYFLPTAPVIHTYNPIFNFGYIHVAHSLIPNEKIRNFFGKQDITTCFIVMQKLIDDGTPQLLRLHGFVHGANAGDKNSSVNVAVELINKQNSILFTTSSSSQTNSVHCHGGVASPSNFDLNGWEDTIYLNVPYWQSFGVYLPATKTATLIIAGQNILDGEMTEITGTPILTYEAQEYLERLLS